MAAKPHLIGGERVWSGQATANINPSDTSDIVGEYACGSEREVDMAVDAACGAMAGWADASPELRSDILNRAAEIVFARAEELGDLLAREEGKTLAEARGEVIRAARILRFFSGEALRVTGDAISSVRRGVEVEVSREAVGVIGVISPWNFPIAIPAWKIAPALAYGNTIIFKPAELVPASAWAFADILMEAGLPAGVLNLVMGPGSVVGSALAAHTCVDAITFTGSDRVGAWVRETAMRRGARVQLEMGGKNPLVVMADCDMETAVDCVLQGAFYSTGQRCTASSRIIIERAIYERFASTLTERMTALKVGDARAADTQIGPVASQAQLHGILNHLERARSSGLDVVGGEPVEGPGFYMRPALVRGTDNRQEIDQTEVFGPVASLIPADSLDHAIDLANDTKFGLSAGICTTSLSHAREFKRRVRAGMVMVNLPTAGVDYHVPFGGTKASSYGPREQGAYAREFFTTVKTSYIAG